MEQQISIQNAYKSAKNYPELVRMLIEIGVQSYTVDVVTDTILYRLSEGQHVIHTDSKSRPVSIPFDEKLTIQAIKSNQQGKTTYLEFMDEIARAGIRFYEATLTGQQKRITYFGAGGQYIENIPV